MFIDVRRRGKGTGGGREGERKRRRDREGERERERKRNINWLPSTFTPTRDWTCNPSTYPACKLNPQPFWCMGQCSNQLSHLSRASTLFWKCTKGAQHFKKFYTAWSHSYFFCFISFHLLCFFKASFNQYVGKLWSIDSLHSSPPPIMELWLDIYWDPGSGVCASLN